MMRDGECSCTSLLSGSQYCILVTMPRPILLSNHSSMPTHQVHMLQQWRSLGMVEIIAVPQKRSKACYIVVPLLTVGHNYQQPMVTNTCSSILTQALHTKATHCPILQFFFQLL